MRRVCLALIATTVFACSFQVSCFAQNRGANKTSGSQQQDPGRIQIVENDFGKTLQTGDGENLRGTAIGLFKYARDTGAIRYMKRRQYWVQLEQAGINSIRVVFFDAWQRSHGAAGSTRPWPHADLNSKQDVKDLLDDLDFLVDATARRGMHLIINYHDAGGYRDPDYSKPAGADGHFEYLKTMDYCQRFWQLIAPRYADRTHVAFELANEPAMWTSDSYDTSVLDDQALLFRTVRRLAPDSHIITLTFANHLADDEQNRSMLVAAKALRARGVRFDNASVAFHPYNRRHPDANPQQPILNLMSEFPVVNTEQNFPKGIIPDSQDPDASGLEGNLMGVQSMERLGIGWFHWNCEDTNDFRDYFLGVVVPDAKAKSYFWRE